MTGEGGREGMWGGGGLGKAGWTTVGHRYSLSFQGWRSRPRVYGPPASPGPHLPPTAHQSVLPHPTPRPPLHPPTPGTIPSLNLVSTCTGYVLWRWRQLSPRSAGPDPQGLQGQGEFRSHFGPKSRWVT